MLVSNLNTLEKLWNELGISVDDRILCHSFLPSLGKLIPDPSIVLESLINTIGPSGTVIIPAFTYSYFKNEIFDPINSKSRVGILGDIARKMEGSVRSMDPCFSMVAIGGKAQYYMERRSCDTFGEGNAFKKVFDDKFKILLIGVDLSALTAFIHLEKMHKVSYRKRKSYLEASPKIQTKFNLIL